MDSIDLGPRRMSTIASEQAEAVERWLDGQNAAILNGNEAMIPKPGTSPRRTPRWLDIKSPLRVLSMNLCSAIFGFNIVMSVLVEDSPQGINLLDGELNFLISIPVVGLSSPEGVT